jgi:predicted CopG family antitoxin
MVYTTLTVREEVARKLRANRGTGESYSDVLNRLLDNQPAKTVGEWLESLAPIEGRSLFTAEERARMKRDQRRPRDSHTRRKGHAAA